MMVNSFCGEFLLQSHTALHGEFLLQSHAALHGEFLLQSHAALHGEFLLQSHAALHGEFLLVLRTLCWFMWGVPLSLTHFVLVYVGSVS